MDSKKDKDEDKKRDFLSKILNVKGLVSIVAALILLYGIIYYLDVNQPKIINNFIRIARYELIFLIFIGVVILIVIQFIQSVENFVKKNTHGNNYTLIAAMLFIYFMFVIEKFPYSMNDVMNLFSNGQPFAILILLLVVVAVVTICFRSIGIIISRKSEYTIEKAHEIASNMIDVATELIGSFIRLVKFVTVDYLIEVKNMVCENTDPENDSESRRDNNEAGDQAGTGDQTGTGNQAGTGSASEERNESNI